MNLLRRWLDADRLETSEYGWALNLAIFRIAFVGLDALPWAIRNLTWIGRILPTLSHSVWSPISFFQLLPLSVLANVSLAQTLAILNLICILFGLVGLFTRPALAGAAVLSLYAFGLMENQGKIDHFHHLVWFLALLAAGPSGRVLSLDALRRKRSARRIVDEQVSGSFDALWTLRYVWILMGLLFLVPGLAKLEKAFVAGWASSSNLQHVLWRKWLEVALYDPNSAYPFRIDQAPAWMLFLAGIGVIFFESGFLFLVPFRRIRPWVALAGLAFHIGNGLFLQIWFTTLIPVYAGLIDWDALYRRFRAVRSTPRADDPGAPAVRFTETKLLPQHLRVVHWVGLGLIVCETVVSFTMFFYGELSGLTARLPRHVRRLIVTAGDAKPEWPFAHYPTFAYPTGVEADLWEARWLVNGREVRVSPQAYDRAFGNSGMVWNLVTDQKDKNRDVSIDLAQELWKAESPGVRDSAGGVNVYWAEYRLQSPGPALVTPVRSTLLYTLPPDLMVERRKHD